MEGEMEREMEWGIEGGTERGIGGKEKEKLMNVIKVIETILLYNSKGEFIIWDIVCLDSEKE